jgi:FSR family fosmidomycin resistance protein-like MFS transporter
MLRFRGARRDDKRAEEMTQAIDLPLPSTRAAETRLVVSVCFAHFVSHYYIMLLAPLFIFVREEYGVSYTELGLALTAFHVISAVVQTPAGFLVDRVNARYVLIAGLLIGATAFTIAGLVNSFWVFIAMFALAGLGNTVYHPADYALLGRHVPSERVGRAFSYHTFSGMVGNAAAPATLVYLHTVIGWRGAFLVAATLGVIAALILALQSDPPVQATARPSAKAGAAQRRHPRMMDGSSCSRRRSSPISCSSSCCPCRAAVCTTTSSRPSANCTAHRWRSPTWRSPGFWP